MFYTFSNVLIDARLRTVTTKASQCDRQQQVNVGIKEVSIQTDSCTRHSTCI